MAVFTSTIYVPTDSYYYPTPEIIGLVKVLVVIILHDYNVYLLAATEHSAHKFQIAAL